MLLSIHPKNPQPRLIQQAAEILKKGGVIIYPTDTIYGIGCDIYNLSAVERICKIKGIDQKKAQFSFLCSDLSHLSTYSKAVETPVFRTLKKHLPGPYTFILNAGKLVPKFLKIKKETVGIRVPDHPICQAIIEALGNPIMNLSVPKDEFGVYHTDPEAIEEQFGNQVDLIIDSGIGLNNPSTVVDCSKGFCELKRQGAGKWEEG